MSRIVITPRDLEAIGRHGEATFPEECCGFLIGRASGDGGEGGETTTVVERLCRSTTSARIAATTAT